MNEREPEKFDAIAYGLVAFIGLVVAGVSYYFGGISAVAFVAMGIVGVSLASAILWTLGQSFAHHIRSAKHGGTRSATPARLAPFHRRIFWNLRSAIAFIVCGIVDGI